MITYNKNNEYETIRFNLIKRLEGEKPKVHDDGKGIATIGIGANITNDVTLRLVLSVGFDVDFDDPDPIQNDLNGKLFNNMRNAISTISSIPLLEDKLDELWREYKRDNNVVFELDPTKIRSLFDALAPTYETEIDKWLADIPESKERAVLFSLSFNTNTGESTLLGPSLKAAIEQGNRARAWIEIRYRSNKINPDDELKHGLASRRYYEAELFGLYDANFTSKTAEQQEQDARDIYDAITGYQPKNTTNYDIRAKVLGYEKLHSSQLNKKHSSVQSLENSLQPAASVLLAKYGEGRNINALDIYVGSDGADTVIARSRNGYQLDAGKEFDKPSLILGGAGIDVLTGGAKDDVLWGEADNDILEGGDGSDIMRGGAGNDIYYADSRDIITDSDGNGSVYLEDTLLTGGKQIAKSSRVYKSADGKYTYVYDKEANTLTINNGLVIQDFTDGHLGIDLVELSDGSNPGSNPTSPKDKPFLPKPPPPPRPEVPRVRRDPLSIDLNQDGLVDTIPMSKGVHFDLNNDGFAELTTWLAPEDGMVILDLNNNGLVDGGYELFGDETLLPNGQLATNGFEALAQYDLNQDGVIDAKDSIFTELKIWQDANSDGRSQADELKSFKDAGIVSINLSYDEAFITDQNNVTHEQIGSARFADGSDALVHTLYFDTDLSNSIPIEFGPVGNAIVSDEILSLPDLSGYGRAYSLHQAMQLDTSGKLQKLVEQFVSEPSTVVRKQLVSSILVTWLGKEAIDPNSRGEHVNAQHLAILEELWGQEAVQAIPVRAYGSLLGLVYANFERAIYTQLMAQSHSQDLFEMMSLVRVMMVTGLPIFLI